MNSQTAEYALRAVVCLGQQHPQPCTTGQISEATDAPASYLAKVIKGLTRSGIVGSRRGLHGGFALAKPPNDLTILDVLTAVEAFHPVQNCPLGRPAHTSGLCPLRRRIDNLMAASEKTVDNMTIGELLQEPNLLCSLPCVSETAGKLEEQRA